MQRRLNLTILTIRIFSLLLGVCACFLMSEVKAQTKVQTRAQAQTLPDLYGKAMLIQACQKDQGDKIIADEKLTPQRKLALLQSRDKSCACFYERARAGGMSQGQMLQAVSQMQNPGDPKNIKDDPLLVKMVNDQRFGGACGLIPYER